MEWMSGHNRHYRDEQGYGAWGPKSATQFAISGSMERSRDPGERQPATDWIASKGQEVSRAMEGMMSSINVVRQAEAEENGAATATGSIVQRKW